MYNVWAVNLGVVYILVFTSVDILVYAADDWCQVNAQIKEVAVYTAILIYAGNLLAGTASWFPIFTGQKWNVTGSGVLFLRRDR